MGLSLRARIENIVHEVETHWLSNKEKFQVQQSINKVMLTVFWNVKGPTSIDFREKGATVYSASFQNIRLVSLVVRLRI